MEDTNIALMEQLAENKDYQGLVDYGYCTQKEAERFQREDEMRAITKLQRESFEQITKEL